LKYNDALNSGPLGSLSGQCNDATAASVADAVAVAWIGRLLGGLMPVILGVMVRTIADIRLLDGRGHLHAPVEHPGCSGVRGEAYQGK
jgi:hypothetical protein